MGLWIAESSGCITLENATEAFECTSTADICINIAGVAMLSKIVRNNKRNGKAATHNASPMESAHSESNGGGFS